MDVGFIGLGHMGAAMATNILEAGHAMTVYNRTPGKDEVLVRKGARSAAGLGGGVAGGRHWAGQQGRRRSAPVSREAHLDAVWRPRLQNLWRADRRSKIRAGRLRGTTRPEGHPAGARGG